MKMIKLKKVESAPYKCRATYEWNGHIIEGDDIGFSGGGCYWYCKDLFGLKGFRTLKGLRKAIELKVENKLNVYNLEECCDM